MLPGSPVPWWSEPITVDVPSQVEAIRLRVIAHRGWTGKVRLALVQNGHTLSPVTFVMSQSTLQVRLSVIGPLTSRSVFSPSISLELEFGEAPVGEPGRPWVIIHPKLPVFAVSPANSFPGTPWASIVYDPRYGRLLSRGNELHIMVQESQVGS